MKKIILGILFHRITIITAVVLFSIIVVSSSVTIYGIHKNVQEMAAAKEAPPYFPEYPKLNTAGRDPNLVKLGEYLVKAGDCIACHTNTPEKEKAKPFAGGLPMHTPFGTIYTPNITPDKKTGLGDWTDAQFIKAMHKGISPKGYYYYPAFPYLYYNKITTDDLKAIKAYLESIPAVEQISPKNTMVWPFNIRFMQLGWRLLFFTPYDSGEFKANPKVSEETNRGAYLAEGLGHCAMCHTPSYHLISDSLSLGAPIRKYNLTGSKVQGYLAPNITKLNLGTVSDQDIIDVFTKDKLIGGGNVVGPMLEVNRDSLHYLPQADLLALARYLKSVNSKTPPKPSGSKVGAAIYEAYCSGCHATGSGGAPKYGDHAAWEPIMKANINTVYDKAIKGYGSMPAKGTCVSCSEDDIKQSVNYMIAAVTGGAAGATIMVAKAPPPLTLEDGLRIYQDNCSVCHDSGFKNAPKPGDKKTWLPIIDAGFLNAYLDVLEGKNGHPVKGACVNCSDAALKAAVKYMMTVSSTDKNYDLW